jgi:hypothetical protein
MDGVPPLLAFKFFVLAKSELGYFDKQLSSLLGKFALS